MLYFKKQGLLIFAGFLGGILLLGGIGYQINNKKLPITIKKEILTGSTFSVMADEAGIAAETASKLLESAKGVYDLANIVAGKDLIFVYNGETGELEEARYDIDKDSQLILKDVSTTTEEFWSAEKSLILYTVEIAEEKGIIEESLYKAVVSQGLDQRLALALAETFAWQIDFAGEIQKGDSFKVIYEKKYRDGVYDYPGKILAAEFINNKEKFQGFYFQGEETKEGLSAEVSTKAGYYDENGNSLQKVFLKAPLQYKYISSGYTYRRFNPILNEYTRHRGIDYAAPQGTSAVSVGDGTVVQAGWNGQLGISVKVRHNETYTTVYGHFMSLAKGIRIGTRVKQGQVVGYVGSTGLSTGPHLHYEMHKFGSFINPFTEKIPAGEPIKEKDAAQFGVIKQQYQKELAEI